MPTHIEIIHAHEFIKATPDGKLDLEESEKMLLEIASVSASAPEVNNHIILDTRKAQSELSLEDIWKLSTEVSKFRGELTGKTAVLSPVNRFDHAGFFAHCAQNNGFNVNAFTSMGEALEWLIET
jgi:hypothetical protein